MEGIREAVRYSRGGIVRCCSGLLSGVFVVLRFGGRRLPLIVTAPVGLGRTCTSVAFSTLNSGSDNFYQLKDQLNERDKSPRRKRYKMNSQSGRILMIVLVELLFHG